jgi:hypothetical protein
MISLLNEAIDRLVKLLAKRASSKGPRLQPPSRASMVIIFLLFCIYEAKVLIRHIGNGRFLSWMYPVLGIQGASWLLGVSEWIFGALLFLVFGIKGLVFSGHSGRRSRSR